MTGTTTPSPVTVCVAVGVSTSNCSTTATTSGKYYILNASTLTGYTIVSGAVTPISGASVTGFNNAAAMAISSDGSYLFVASSNGITPFTISSTGALTKGTSFDTLNSSIGALAVDPAGRWLLAASSAGILSAYPISSGASTGGTAYSQQLNLGTTGSISGIAVSPSGYTNDDLVAVAMGSTGTGLFTFSSTTSTGPLSGEGSIIPPIGSAGGAVSTAIDPQNRLLYIGETGATSTTGALRVFTITDTGVNSLDSYTPAGTGPRAILPSADGGYVYTANWGVNEISGYSTGSEPNGLAEDSTGSFVLAISYDGSPAFDAYGLSSGVLSLSTSNSTINSPVAIVAVP